MVSFTLKGGLNATHKARRLQRKFGADNVEIVALETINSVQVEISNCKAWLDFSAKDFDEIGRMHIFQVGKRDNYQDIELSVVDTITII